MISENDKKLFSAFVSIIENGTESDWLFFGELLLHCYRNPDNAMRQVNYLKTIIDDELDDFYKDLVDFVNKLYTKDMLGEQYIEGVDLRTKLEILEKYLINLVKG